MDLCLQVLSLLLAFASELVRTVEVCDANHFANDCQFRMDIYSLCNCFCSMVLTPIEQSTVFFRMMLVGSFINSIRLIVIYMGEDGGANPVPMIASILVFVLMNILYNRSGMRIGVTM